MAGRGGYYGSLHPAYQGFHEQRDLGGMQSVLEDSSGSRNHATQAASSKLDEILTLLRNQDDRITSLTSEVTSVKEELVHMKRTEKKGRIPVPRDLSRLTKAIHESFCDVKQFDPSELYMEKHNEEVREAMIEEIKASGSDHSSNEIKQAVHRCYDGKRRSWTDMKPSSLAQVEKNKEKSSRSAKQTQLYKRRAKVLKGKEGDYWNSIDASYMSEESAHESSGELVMHKHTPDYRSEGLNKLIEKLDQRYHKSSSKKPTAFFKAFPRVVRSPSKQPPKPNAPTWAIRQNYQASNSTPLYSTTSTPISSGTSTPVSSSNSTPLSSAIRHTSRRCLQLSDTLLEEVVSSSSDELDLSVDL